MSKPYRRMLAAMREKEKEVPKRRREKWFVYILRCGDLSLYTGIAKDPEKRLRMHEAGKGARYTRSRLPLDLVYRETCRSRAEALVREHAVKRLPRPAKLALIENFRSRPARRVKA